MSNKPPLLKPKFVTASRINNFICANLVGYIWKELVSCEQFVQTSGNNYFDQELVEFLDQTRHSDDISSWILMERIQATVHRNRLIRVGLGPECRNVVSELGIFGVHIRLVYTNLELPFYFPQNLFPKNITVIKSLSINLSNSIFKLIPSLHLSTSW